MRLKRLGRFVVDLDADPRRPVTSMDFVGADAEALQAFIASLPEAMWPSVPPASDTTLRGYRRPTEPPDNGAAS